MNIHLLQVSRRFRQLSFYVPFTVYFFVFLVAGFFAYRLLGQNEIGSYSSYSDIFSLLLKIAFAFCASIISIALLTVLMSLLFFLNQCGKKAVEFKISTDFKETDLQKKQTVRLLIRPVLKPFLGFLKLRLGYDQTKFSDKFSLIANGKSNFFSTTIEGNYHWPLPEIKEYHVQKVVLYFEDVFQFFSFAVTLPANNHFFTQPTPAGVKELRVLPRKTEETNIRIEELRRVNGEYLNYKNFEDNDDVRRIVWKIYAKNKELVVRVPEIMDPYASHIYLFASFFANFSVSSHPVVEIPFLNYYKVFIWSVYQNLVRKGFEVRYIPDQELNKNNLADEQQWVKYAISTSRWHHNMDLKSFVKTNDASVVVISSLTDVKAVQELIEFAGKDITFIFIKLSDSFKNHSIVDWLQWFFVINAKDDMDAYKRAWSLSPMRQKIKDNEKLLERLVNKYEEVVEV